MKLIDNWKQSHKFATMWVAGFWGAFGGALMFLPSLAGILSPVRFGVLCIVMSVTYAVARVTHQPGIE